MVEQPPNIYKWIEENAHICTSVPSNGENIVNFLTPAEGLKCSLCPDHNPRESPSSACAVELSPNEIDVDIGCHPIPELCLMELKTRYADFFTSKPKPANSAKSTEDIFMTKSNPFEKTVINQLGRSSNVNLKIKTPRKEISIPKSNVFAPQETTRTTSTSTTTRPATVTSTTPTSTSTFTTTTTATTVTTPTTTTSHSTTTTTTTPTSTITTTARTTTTTQPPFHADNNLGTSSEPLVNTATDAFALMTEVDADSGGFTTIRANIFSSPSVMQPVNLTINNTDMAMHSRTALPLGPLNKEVLPGDFKWGEKSHIDKRVGQSIWAKRPTLPNWINKKMITTTPTTLIVNVSASVPGTTTKKECKDAHLLCCFWAIAGECDSNPFWMRIHCSKTCGTCDCSLNEADQCNSTGVVCEIPTTTTTTTTTTTATSTTLTTTLPTTTTTEETTTRNYGRFTVKPRLKLPSWKQRPLPPGPPSYKPPETDEFIDRGEPGIRPPFEPKDGVLLDKFPAYGEGYGASGQRSTLEPPPLTTEFVPTSTTSIPPTPSTTTFSTCFNYNPLCEFWADLGECAKNPFWMRPNCQRSCRSCGESVEDVYAPQAKPGCSNEHQLCPFWGFIGECVRNPRWMLKHCRPSCRVC
ncbi:unnamed protein product [Bursaphelenchus xylophilus]|uniref:(pine wood nematode) hypothetical protein n=1 Tax=Bursaphelenchus xylophilus TaxID=6326 RepID=A0A1I7RZ67_BURXY|nr:unnamed protein product [Bursaphelenchus xylophilus]CAG9106799.1 unnamed protein product [Bursaphelenchus xylophilus]